jgi:hypothetical protein
LKIKTNNSPFKKGSLRDLLKQFYFQDLEIPPPPFGHLLKRRTLCSLRFFVEFPEKYLENKNKQFSL